MFRTTCLLEKNRVSNDPRFSGESAAGVAFLGIFFGSRSVLAGCALQDLAR